MMCPHCGHNKSRVTDTEDRETTILRYRVCRGCSSSFSTIERVAVFGGRQVGYLETPDSTSDGCIGTVVGVPADTLRRAARFKAAVDDPRLAQFDDELRALLVEWWNVSRYSKHRAKATWTETAWELSVARLASLPPDQQNMLASGGVEHGWQALKPEYLESMVPRLPPAQPATAPARPMPRDHSMLAALDQWPSTA